MCDKVEMLCFLFQGGEKRFAADAYLLELRGSAHFLVSVQAAMSSVQRHPERMLGRVYADVCRCCRKYFKER